MRRLASLAVLLCVGSWCGFASAADIPDDVALAIRAQREAVDRVETAHVVAESRIDYGDGGVRLEQSIEWWHSDDLDRFGVSTHGIMNSESGEWTAYDPPIRKELGYDAKDIRYLENWDSDQVLDKPLTPGGEEGRVFASIKASIHLRDPTGPTTQLFSWLLLVPFPTHTLHELTEASSSSSVVSRSPEELILELRGGPFCEKTLIVLAPSKGNLIQRCEWYQSADDSEPVTVNEIVEFRDFGNGVFFPVHGVTRRGEKALIDLKVTEAAINEPLDSGLATVRFPEGARVDKVASGEIFIWGKDSPELTFTSFSDFQEWEVGTAAKTAKGETAGGGIGVSTPFLIANVALLGAIGVVVFLRWKFRKKQG